MSDRDERRASLFADSRGWLPLAAVLALYLLRVARWLLSDLWFDEIVTLSDFAFTDVGGGSLLSVFRHYPVANNHVLYSAILWFWVRLAPFSSHEWVLRLPSFVFGALGVVVIVRHWRQWIGERQALAAGLLFAMSPVYTAFSYQLRGYSLSMLLALLGLSGVMEVLGGSRRRGLVLCCLSSFLLPVVIPTNALVVAAHWLVLASGVGRSEARRSTRWSDLRWVGVSGLLGCSYYLTIWPQVVGVLEQTQGWDSGWRVGGSLAVGFLAHVGPVLPAWLWRRSETAACARELQVDRRTAGVCAVAALLVLSPVLVFCSPVPFPRTFLVLLPLTTFALMLGVRGSGFWRPSLGLLYVGLVIGHGFCWESACRATTARRVAAGEHPQGLLLQYYRGSVGLSGIAQAVRGRRLRVGVMVDPYDAPGLRYYWHRAFGEPGGALLPEQALAESPSLGRRWLALCEASARRPCAVAANVAGARRLFQLVGLDAEPVPLVTTADRVLFAAAGAHGDARSGGGGAAEDGGGGR